MTLVLLVMIEIFLGLLNILIVLLSSVKKLYAMESFIVYLGNLDVPKIILLRNKSSVFLLQY